MKKAIIAFIKFYQRHISGSKGYASCKYYPTCSSYAIQAVEVHGPLKGSLLAIYRILRCNPFSEGGYDPVPYIKIKEEKRV